MKMVSAAVALAAMVALAPEARAEWKPTKTITIVSPFTGVGPAVIVGQTLAKHLGDRLGVNVIMEPRQSADGVLGTRAMINEAPDGYTFVLATNTSTAGRQFWKNPDATYDLKKLDMILLAGEAFPVLVVSANSSHRTVKDLVEAAKARPKEKPLQCGFGTLTNRIVLLAFAKAAGIAIQDVQYRGESEQLIGGIETRGEIECAVLTGTNGIERIAAGTLRGLAVLGGERTSFAPSLPTLAESGVKGIETRIFIGLAAPAGTPKEVGERIRKEVRAILEDPKVREIFRANSLIPRFGDGKELQRRIEDESVMWAAVIKLYNLPQRD